MQREKTATGLAAATSAYLAWGLFPLYWKQLEAVSALHIVAHRVIWSFAFVALLLVATKRWREFSTALTSWRTLWPMLCSTSLISCNWLLFIWAINSGRITQGSLGYYINPLANVLLATVFLGERLRPLQLLAIALAAIGVINLTVAGGEFPWVALTLASTFAVYGLVRKLAPIEALPGLGVETFLVTPLALGWVVWMAVQRGAFLLGEAGLESALLVGAGVVTALPLLWFAVAARRLRYATMGVLQYIAPTCQLGIAVLVYGEPFTHHHAITFTLIWIAVILYAVDSVRAAAASRIEAQRAEEARSAA